MQNSASSTPMEPAGILSLLEIISASITDTDSYSGKSLSMELSMHELSLKAVTTAFCCRSTADFKQLRSHFSPLRWSSGRSMKAYGGMLDKEDLMA